MSACDAVDGSHPPASRRAKVMVSMNHRETGAENDGTNFRPEMSVKPPSISCFTSLGNSMSGLPSGAD